MASLSDNSYTPPVSVSDVSAPPPVSVSDVSTSPPVSVSEAPTSPPVSVSAVYTASPVDINDEYLNENDNDFKETHRTYAGGGGGSSFNFSKPKPKIKTSKTKDKNSSFLDKTLSIGKIDFSVKDFGVALSVGGVGFLIAKKTLASPSLTVAYVISGILGGLALTKVSLKNGK